MTTAARTLCAILLTATVAVAGSPFVDHTVPRGARLGTDVDVVFHGEWLQDTAGVLFLRAGITVLEVEGLGRKSARVRFRIAEDCPLGEHLLFVRTQSGLSNLVAFWVGAMAEIEEEEGNDGFGEAQPIPLDCTVNGLCRREDRDVFAFTVVEKGRISFEIQAGRIGNGDFDPVVEIHDGDHHLIRSVDDTVLGRVDPLGSVILEPGNYFLTVFDAARGGAPDCHYRLHLGRFPRPHVASPPGFRRGEKTTLTILSDTETLTREVSMKRADRIHHLFVEDEGGISPTPIRLLTHPMAAYTETDAPEIIEKLPFAFAGTLSEAGEVDEVRFTCDKGISLRCAAYAWTVASPLDPVLDLLDESGRLVARADDGMGIDTRLNRSTRRGGVFSLRIRDLHRRGGERFVYRIEVIEEKPGRSQRLLPPTGYLSPAAIVPRGGRLVTAIRGANLDVGASVRPRFRDLPDGVTAHVLPYREDSSSIPVVFEAAADAPLSHGMVRVDLLEGEGEKSKPRPAGFYHSYPLTRVDRTLVYEARGLGRMPCAVVAVPPIEIEVLPPEVPLVAGSTIDLRVLVRRPERFAKSQIRLVGSWAPPGISIGKVDVPANASEVRLAVSARAGTRSATWPLAVSVLVENRGRVVSSSELFDLKVEEPWAVAKAGICRVRRGESSVLRVTLDVKTAWKGAATLEILGSAKWFAAPPARVTADMTVVELPVNITGDAPLGTRSLYLSLTVPSPDGDLVHRFRTGEIRIEKASPSARLGARR